MTTRQEIWCTCGHCQGTWSIMALPATVEAAATAMLDATCPNCSPTPKKLFLAHERDIVAAQQRAVPA